jgi:hypothetical protein
MEDIKKFYVFGSITKEETLKNVEYNVIENTLVVENMVSFPGYHHDVPIDTKPNFIFLVLSKQYSDIEIFRATKNIKSYSNIKFSACPGNIHIFTDDYACIRLRGLDTFEHVEELQRCYIDEGIKMHKHKSMNSKALISLNKSFALFELENGIYKDLEDDFMYYVKIPMQLKWKLFEKFTYSIKNNIDNKNYDAALGYFITPELSDFVRVYAHEPSCTRLEEIQKKYLEEISRYLKN